MNEKHYSTLQNRAWLLRYAWHNRKSVIFIYLGIGLAGVAESLIELFVAPQILSQLENGAGVLMLLRTIVLFNVGLIVVKGIRTYLQANSMFGESALGQQIYLEQDAKYATTAYPHTEDPAFKTLLNAATEVWRVMSGSYDQHCVWEQMAELMKSVIGLIIYIILLQNLPWQLIVIVLLTAAAAWALTLHLGKWEKEHEQERGEYQKKLNYLDDRASDISLGKDIRLFGMQNWLEEIYDGALRMYYHFMQQLGLRMFLIDLTDIVLTFLRNGIAYFFLIRMVLNGSISVSQFLLYFTAFTGLTAWITGILQKSSILHRLSAYVSAHRRYMEIDEPFRFEDGKDIPIPSDGQYTFTLENVRFRHPGTEQDTIPCINLTIRAGEKLAIVGLNGAGKTTLVRLISGLYDPTEGRVLLNGEDIRQFNRRQYYQLFTAVFQNFSVLPATIGENVAQSVSGYDISRVRECLKLAGLSEKVDHLSQGVDTPIGKEVFDDGITLSGGETQRLMLARALYKDAPILILDEPTAALDPLAENQIYQHYNEMASGRTSIFISHRLASTRFCDRILMLEDGQIAEEGTHDALMSLDGKYAHLFQVQAQYYQEEADHAE